MSAIAIVPAAGKAERFGGGKLLADVDGEPLLHRTIQSLLDGGLARVVVTIAPGADFSSVAALKDPRVSAVVNPEPSRGMFSSIQAALAAAEGDPILVLPGDMPFVRAETIRAVTEAAATSGRVVSPRHGGKRGHPVALPARMRAELLRADPSTTLAAILAAHSNDHESKAVDDPGVRRDVDVRADLAP